MIKKVKIVDLEFDYQINLLQFLESHDLYCEKIEIEIRNWDLQVILVVDYDWIDYMVEQIKKFFLDHRTQWANILLHINRAWRSK